MKVSREFAIDHLKMIRKVTSDWIRELEKPETVTNGQTEPIYPDGVPKGLSISSVEGIPVDQFRAELLSMAGMLVALAGED